MLEIGHLELPADIGDERIRLAEEALERGDLKSLVIVSPVFDEYRKRGLFHQLCAEAGIEPPKPRSDTAQG